MALFKNISSEFSPVFRLLEDVLLDDCLQISRETSWGNMQQRKKQTSHVKLSVETITETINAMRMSSQTVPVSL